MMIRMMTVMITMMTALVASIVASSALPMLPNAAIEMYTAIRKKTEARWPQ